MIAGKVTFCLGIPDDIDSKEAAFFRRKFSDIDHFNQVSKKITIENRILHCGKKLILSSAFSQNTYKVDKIYAGDGAIVYLTNGYRGPIVFPDENYPERNERVRNEVFSNAFDSISSTEVTDENGAVIGIAAVIRSDLHQTGNFQTNNVNMEINNLSLCASGVDLPSIDFFSGSEDIPVSNITIPPTVMNPGVPAALYINWIFGIV